MQPTFQDENDKHHRFVLTPWSVQAGLHPPVMVRGEGSFLIDREEKRYLDLSSGWIAVNLGYGHKKMVQAIQEQAERLCWAPPTYFNDVRAEYAAALVRLAPWKEGGRVHFTTGGGEANDDAMKIARLVTGRPKLLAAYRSYHGSTRGHPA